MSAVHLVTGDDDTVRGDRVRALVAELVGDADAGLAVDRVEGEDYELGQAVDAAHTPPFLTECRVVVVRHLGRFGADELGPMLEYLADPLPTTSLVLVWERAPGQQRLNKAPKKLVDAVVAAHGEVTDTSIGSGKVRRQWLDERMAASGVQFDKSARDAVADRLGDDADRVGTLVATIEAAYGDGVTVSAEDVEPFLGEAGSVPPWELTDAIDSGDIRTALDKLHRMIGAGGMHALQVMALLTTHVRRILALEGAPVRNEKEAAELLGMKGSTFPARKALSRANKLGYESAAEAMSLLAEADVDLRGAKAWPDELVLEVLVARLARLSR